MRRGAARDRAVGGHVEGRAGRQGRHIFHTRLRLPHSEVIHPVCLEVRPAFELLSAELKVSGAFPGRRCWSGPFVATGRSGCRRPVEILFAGRTYRSRIGKGEPVSPGSGRAGKRAASGDGRRGSRTFPRGCSPRGGVPIPGEDAGTAIAWRDPVRVTLRAPLGPGGAGRPDAALVALRGMARWREGVCRALHAVGDPRNDCLEALFTRATRGMMPHFSTAGHGMSQR